MHPKDADPDQTAPLGQSELSVHCLARPVCPKY